MLLSYKGLCRPLGRSLALGGGDEVAGMKRFDKSLEEQENACCFLKADARVLQIGIESSAE